MKNNDKNKADGSALYEPFEPSLYIPTNARLSSSIQALTGRYITEIYSPKRRVYNEWIKMLEKDPVAAFCASIKVLRAQIIFGEYTHKSKDYQEFIRQNFANMEGSFRNVVARLASAMTFGCAVAEVNFSSTTPGYRNKWVLKNINILDIRNISARGRNGKVFEWGYRDRYNNTVYIDHRKCLHVTNTDLIPYNTDLIWGSADCERALNWYKLRQLVATEFAIAAKNNSVGKLWGKTNSSQRMQLYDANDQLRVDQSGKPLTVSKQKALYMQLKELDQNDLIVTDLETDLQILQTQTGEAFWSYAFDLVEKNMALSFNVPVTLFRESVSSSFGNTGLSQNHKSMLDAGIESVVQTIREEVINKIVKPLLIWEFGENKDYGEFEFLTPESAVDRNSLVSTALSAVASGVIDPNDKGLQNFVRKSIGLEPQTDAEKQDAEKLQQLDIVTKWLNSHASQQAAKSQIDEAQVKQKELQQVDPNLEEKPVEPDNQQYP
ncbi:MAG: hypothetical protein IM613_12650 [Cytophagales bacterium]|nr:hypothetical protein [Cytophagales bacterium]